MEYTLQWKTRQCVYDMKQAWNAFFSYQVNSTLSFKFSVLKSSDRSLNSRICSFSLHNIMEWISWASQMTSRIQRMRLKACSILMKSSVGSAIWNTGSFLLLNGPVFTWTVGHSRSPGTAVTGATLVSVLSPDFWSRKMSHLHGSFLTSPSLSRPMSELPAFRQRQCSTQERRRVGVGAS